MDFSGPNTDAPAKVPRTRRTTAVNKNPSLDLRIAHLRLVFTTDTVDIILLRRTNAEETPARVVFAIGIVHQDCPRCCSRLASHVTEFVSHDTIPIVLNASRSIIYCARTNPN